MLLFNDRRVAVDAIELDVAYSSVYLCVCKYIYVCVRVCAHARTYAHITYPLLQHLCLFLLHQCRILRRLRD
jgi:hypothetical protein